MKSTKPAPRAKERTTPSLLLLLVVVLERQLPPSGTRPRPKPRHLRPNNRTLLIGRPTRRRRWRMSRSIDNRMRTPARWDPHTTISRRATRAQHRATCILRYELPRRLLVDGTAIPLAQDARAPLPVQPPSSTHGRGAGVGRCLALGWWGAGGGVGSGGTAGHLAFEGEG